MFTPFKPRCFTFMNASKTKVTVLMAVYNGEKYLREAIDSILRQTFTDFEFLIINDGSTDNSVEIIKSYDDKRIHLVHNEKNIGLAASLNKGLKLAQGDYVARMDCDDISYPLRLEKQVKFMDKHLDIGICGAWMRTFGETKEEVLSYPTSNEEISATLFYKSAISHPTIIFRKKIFQEFNIYYNPKLIYAQDFDLWNKLRAKVKFANIPEVLYYYRVLQSSQYHTKKLKHPEIIHQIYKENLEPLKIT